MMCFDPISYDKAEKARKHSENVQEQLNQVIAARNDDYESRRAIIEKNAMDFIPNVEEPLNIPTYVSEDISGHEHLTHPNVLYFPNGWNGYKFWMTYTPYPYSDNQYENPSIVASNDNITWVEPAPNPVAPLEPTDTFQSDPEILMNGDTMELWYRATVVEGSTLFTTMYRKQSTDGVNWTEREKMFDNNSFENMRSPAIIREDGLYKSWYNSDDGNGNFFMKYAESADGKNWNSRILDIELNYKDYTFWHGDVYKHDDGKIDMVIACRSDNNPGAIFYTYSYDNVNFVPPILLVKPVTGKGPGQWDSINLYKADLTMVDDEYYLYYATGRAVGLTTGKSLLELGKDIDRGFNELHPIRVFKSARDAYSPTDNYDKFPKEAIIYTLTWSSSGLGWPTTSGVIITDTTYYAPNRVKQYYYPDGVDYFMIRTAKTNGWSEWKTVQTS